MPPKTKQIYEEYWKYTAAWTDLNGTTFRKVLSCCIDFFDTHTIIGYDKKIYESLQQEVRKITKIDDASVRKGINQLVKIGFLLPYLGGYVPEAKEYVDARTDKRRCAILSKTVYNHSNFQNSMTAPSVRGQGQIQFLLKTLEELGEITNDDLLAIMTVDIADYKDKGYMTEEELEEVRKKVVGVSFEKRKYNQRAHLMNLVGKLDDLRIHRGSLYFKTDADRLFGSDFETRKSVRDPYLQRVYKSELEDESMFVYGSDAPKCMVEGMAHPVLIASHIKPYISSGEKERFDVNNGLLLSKNMDSLFDLGYITFEPDGRITPAKDLPHDIVKYVSGCRLDKRFINDIRLKYMEFHKKHVFEKRYKSSRHHVLGAPGKK